MTGQIAAINTTMEQYLANGVFRTLPEALIYGRTQSDGRVRRGLIGMVDLEQYDFTPGSGALIRATEGTVLSASRRVCAYGKTRPIELPHVMLLIDDPERTVIEPLAAGKQAAEPMEKLYDFDLQQGGGHLAGWQLSGAQADAVAVALSALCSEEAMETKYGLRGVAPLLFAVGTATTRWQLQSSAMRTRKDNAPRAVGRPACALCAGRGGQQP